MMNKKKAMASTKMQPKKMVSPTSVSRVATALAEAKGSAMGKKSKVSNKKK